MINKENKVKINGHDHVAFQQDYIFSADETLIKSQQVFEKMDKRRSIRSISDKPVAREVIENLIKTASTAPSGAHKQPWTFCAVSNPEVKSKIREAAEAEEKVSYESRMSERWLNDLEHLGTDMHKPFLEEAPWLIIAFKEIYKLDKDGKKHNNYYVNESVGIACGLLISAIHEAGLVTLTHTPSPMNFLAKLLKRPANERAYILFPVGYAADEVYVPNIERLPLEKVSVFFE